MVIAVIWPSKNYYYDYPYHGESRYTAKIIMCLRGVLGHTVDVVGEGKNTITMEEALTKNYDVVIEHDVRTELGRAKKNDSVLWHGNWTMPFKKVDFPDATQWIWDTEAAQERPYDRHLAWHNLSIWKSQRYKLSKKTVIWHPPMVPVNVCQNKFRLVYSPPFAFIDASPVLEASKEICEETGYKMDVTRMNWYLSETGGLAPQITNETIEGKNEKETANMRACYKIISQCEDCLNIMPSMPYDNFMNLLDQARVVITIKHPDPFVAYLTMEACVQGAAVVCEKDQEEYMKPNWGHQINPWRGPGAAEVRTQEIKDGVIRLLNNYDYWHEKRDEATEELRKETDLDSQAAKLEEWLKEDVYGR